MDILFSLALSAHLGFQNEYNFIHPHIRLQQDRLISGAYYNSESNISAYAGYRFEYNNIGIELGAVTGYSDADILPYIRATYNDLFVAPATEYGKLGIVFGVEIPLK